MNWLKRVLKGKETEPAGEFAALLKESREHLEGLTFMHQTSWRFGQHDRWDLDPATRTLRFTFPDGDVVNCTAQAIGSYNAESPTWMWAWANQSLAPFPEFLKYAMEARDYGRKHEHSKLVTPAWKSDPDEAWSMTALAVKLCNGKGAFCGMHGPLQMYLAFEEVRLSRFSGVESPSSEPGE